MDFALLGTGHETVPFINAIVDSPEHRLVAFVVDDALAQTILEKAPAARRLASHAEVLNVNGLEAVVIDTESPEVLEVAKQLATNSVAILLVPHATHGIEFIYQLGLIRDEQPDQFRLYPLRLWRSHPLLERLREALQQDRLGRIHQIQLDRELHDPEASAQPALLTKSQIDERLLSDADLLKYIAGEFDQVTALCMGDEEAGFVQSSVSLSGPQALPAQWTCRGTSGSTTWRLTVGGAAGSITVSGSDDWRTMQWQSTISGTKQDERVEFDVGPVALSEFLAGLTSANTNHWANDLNRDFDLLEGSHRSLRRKRTVELYFDTPSERSNFKTQMTAVGCGVLMLTLMTILMGLGAGLVAQQLKLHPAFMQVVRVLVFAPLFIFLLLQAGIVLSKPSAKHG